MATRNPVPQQMPIDASECVVLIHVDTDDGRRLACDLISAGHRVVVTSPRLLDLPPIMLGRRHGQVLAFAADVNDPSQLAKVVSRAEERFDGIDAVIDARAARPELPASVAA